MYLWSWETYSVATGRRQNGYNSRGVERQGRNFHDMNDTQKKKANVTANKQDRGRHEESVSSVHIQIEQQKENKAKRWKQGS
jgi:hypothetical protein